jgi:hypothetical protein
MSAFCRDPECSSSLSSIEPATLICIGCRKSRDNIPS